MDEVLDIPGTRHEGCSMRDLERLHAGELTGPQAAQVQNHAKTCGRCQQKLNDLQAAAAQFKRELSFAQFEQAVMAKQRPSRRHHLTSLVGLALAASVTALVWTSSLKTAVPHHSVNNRKGDVALELYIGGAWANPRIANEGELLSAGERVRVGFQAVGAKYVLVLSVDEHGTASPLYPESGQSMPVPPGDQTQLMPDSLDLTGQGLEKFIALFSDQPLSVTDALAAASQEFSRAGSLGAMKELPLNAKQSMRTLHKP